MTAQIYNVVFEDSHLMVIEKTAPFLSQRSDQGQTEGLYEFVSRQTRQKLFPVHRLDREVLGLMVFAKNKRVADALADSFRERRVNKGYLLEVEGRVAEERQTLIHYLKKNEKTNYVTVYPKPTEGAKRAELEYVRMSVNGHRSTLFVRLKTGRTHQIRAQLAKIGHSIVGDSRYGKKSDPLDGGNSEIQLKSVWLGFEHPVEKVYREWWLIAPLSRIEDSSLKSE